MKEYMLLIRNRGDYKATFPMEIHQEFVKKCEAYINALISDGKLLAAQPLTTQGVVISGSSDSFNETKIDEDAEIQIGYYHILAHNMDEAIAIAKRNPEFEYGTTASIEVRPVKTIETSTGFTYPNQLKHK